MMESMNFYLIKKNRKKRIQGRRVVHGKGQRLEEAKEYFDGKWKLLNYFGIKSELGDAYIE